jgi:hypothetical protein
MANRKIGRDSTTGKLTGVSTSDDVKAFRSANTALMHKVTSSKDAARVYVRELEKRAGISSKKK